MLDHRAVIPDFPSDGSELLAVSGHQDKVVTTQYPVKTQTSISLSRDSSVLPGNDLVSLDHGWMAAFSSGNQTSFCLQPLPWVISCSHSLF